MKRDMDLIRKILFYIEDNYQPGKPIHIEIDGYDLNTTAEHCLLLYQDKLISYYAPYYGDGSILFIPTTNLTNKGYRYLDSIRDECVWEETKKEVKKKKLPQTIEMIGTIAARIAGAFLGEYNK